jgi:hypothetical protein
MVYAVKVKRTLASLLSLALVLQALPSRAAAPVVVLPATVLPVAGPAAAAAPAALSLAAPALPAASWPAAASVLSAPAPLAAPLPASFSPAFAAPTGAAAPALRALSAAALPAAPAGLFFDGAAPRGALDAPLPAAADAPLSSFSRPSRLARAEPPARRPRREPNALRSFTKSLLLTATLAAGLPPLWSAVPFAKFGYLDAVAMAACLAVLDLVWTGRLLLRAVRGRAPPAASTRKAVVGAVLAGVLLGFSAGALPSVLEKPIIERGSALLESARPAEARENLRAVPGDAMRDEAVKVLSANPVGRQVLDRLRDRGGVVRLPPFFVSDQPDSYAQHSDDLGTLEIASSEIVAHGWTVDRFLASPDLQRQLAREMAPTIAHELTHEVQGRLSPLGREFWARGVMEHEYESFMVEHAYIHAMLKADPSAPIRAPDLSRYREGLDDMDAYLARFDSSVSYKANAHYDFPRWRRFHADFMKDWAAHRVEGYLLLARRDAKDSPQSARMDLIKARDAALSAGLPPPKLPDSKGN